MRAIFPAILLLALSTSANSQDLESASRQAKACSSATLRAFAESLDPPRSVAERAFDRCLLKWKMAVALSVLRDDGGLDRSALLQATLRAVRERYVAQAQKWVEAQRR